MSLARGRQSVGVEPGSLKQQPVDCMCRRFSFVLGTGPAPDISTATERLEVKVADLFARLRFGCPVWASLRNLSSTVYKVRADCGLYVVIRFARMTLYSLSFLLQVFLYSTILLYNSHLASH